MFDDKLPIYIQIVNFIKGKIASKEYGAGEKLPSVRELSSELKVNPNTIQRSYGELEEEGLTYTKRGMGTFVIEDEELIDSLRKEIARDSVKEFLEKIEVLGLTHDEIIDLIEESRDGQED